MKDVQIGLGRVFGQWPLCIINLFFISRKKIFISLLPDGPSGNLCAKDILVAFVTKKKKIWDDEYDVLTDYSHDQMQNPQ